MLIVQKKDILNDLYFLKSIGYEYIDYFSYNKIKFLPKNLNLLKDIVNNCNLCTLSNICNSRTFETSDVQDIIFIREKRFTNNNAFNFFEKFITDGLNIKKELYIINILKCDISLDGYDYTKALEICKQYALKQLEIINPKVIIALGDSYKYLLNVNKIDDMNRANNLKFNNSDLFIVKDPDYLIRNPTAINEELEKLKIIKTKMEKI